MINKNQLKTTFENVLGSSLEIEFKENHIGSEDVSKKEFFCSAILSWGNAWKQQNTLFNKYGLDFSGYDNLLYGSIEALILMIYGKTKFYVISSYVYNLLDPIEDALRITDKNGKTYFVSNVEELFDFIEQMNDEDFTNKEE